MAGQDLGQRPRHQSLVVLGLSSVGKAAVAFRACSFQILATTPLLLKLGLIAPVVWLFFFFRKVRVLSLKFKSGGLAQSPPLKSFSILWQPRKSGSPRLLVSVPTQAVRVGRVQQPGTFVSLPPFLPSSVVFSTCPSFSCLLSFLHRESNCAKPRLPRTNPDRDPGTGTTTPPRLDEAAGPALARAWRRSSREGTSRALETPGRSSSSMEPVQSGPCSLHLPPVLCGMYRSPPLLLAGTPWGRVVVIPRRGQRGGTLLGHKARLIGDPQSPRQVSTVEVSNWLRPLVQKSSARDVIVCVYLYFRRFEWVN